VSDAPVSTRRIFHTILDWAGLGADPPACGSGATPEVVLGEAMKPFLAYGWQPQVMAVEGTQGDPGGGMEVYDLAPTRGARDLSDGRILPPLRAALRDYPVPSPVGRGPAAPLDEERREAGQPRLRGATAAPVVRKDAPRPVDMVPVR
jgi:hypothetical protein